MKIIERIRLICKENGITVTDLEKELGYSNGSLAKAKDIPSSRILDISKKLNVPMEYIMTGEYSDLLCKNDNMTQKIRNDIELSKALSIYFELPDAKKELIIELINMLN